MHKVRRSVRCADCGHRTRLMMPTDMTCPPCGGAFEVIVNTTYKLSERDRLHISVMAHLVDRSRRPGWTLTAVAKAWGVTRKTVNECKARYALT